jgi:hypothetical protein
VCCIFCGLGIDRTASVHIGRCALMQAHAHESARSWLCAHALLGEACGRGLGRGRCGACARTEADIQPDEAAATLPIGFACGADAQAAADTADEDGAGPYEQHADGEALITVRSIGAANGRVDCFLHGLTDAPLQAVPRFSDAAIVTFMNKGGTGRGHGWRWRRRGRCHWRRGGRGAGRGWRRRSGRRRRRPRARDGDHAARQ